jgi:hypothetical protein
LHGNPLRETTTQTANSLFSEGGSAELAPVVHDFILSTLSKARVPLRMTVGDMFPTGVKVCYDFTGMDESACARSRRVRARRAPRPR